MEIKLFVDKSIPDEDIKEEVAFLRRCMSEWIPEPKHVYFRWSEIKKAYKKAYASPFDVPFMVHSGDTAEVEMYDIKILKTDLCTIEDAYTSANLGNKIYIASLNPRYSAYQDDKTFCKMFTQGSSNISLMRKAMLSIVKERFIQNKVGNDCKTAITKYLLGQTFADLRGEDNA